MEIWKDVIGWEGIYSVSSLGRVRRDAGGNGTKAGRILNPSKRGKYLCVVLSRPGKLFGASVHRLVAEAFIGQPPSSRHQVNHKNFDRKDNRPENLEYVTASENITHAYKNNRKPVGEAHHKAKLKESDVKEMRRKASEGTSVKKLSEQYPVSKTMIRYIINRKSWKHI